MCGYDAIYHRLALADLDPALNLDFWLSSGPGSRLASRSWCHLLFMQNLLASER